MGDKKDMAVVVWSIHRLRPNKHSWESPSKRNEKAFERIQRLVNHIAPEQFRNPARPSFGPCNIVPTSLLEYMEHSMDVLKMATVQMLKNKAAKKEAARMIDGKSQPPIISILGNGGKTYKDGLSPVLMKQTMWSIEYDQHEQEEVEWPTRAELQVGGGRYPSRKRNDRSFPEPRVKIVWDMWDPVNTLIRRVTQGYTTRILSPFDQPGIVNMHEVSLGQQVIARALTDHDPELEKRGRELIGTALMEEVGEYKAPFVPDWLAYRRRR